VNRPLEVLHRLRIITLCSSYSSCCDEGLRFLDVFLPSLGLGDDLVSELFSCVELTHSTECLEPAFVDNELVSGVRVGGGDFERLVEISERIIVGAQLHVSVSNRAEVTNLRPSITKHHCSHEGTGDSLAGRRHVSFKEQGESEFARGAVFQLLVTQRLSEL